eukprot:5455075-Pyramimonas_sp.AAC.1
MLSPSTKRTSWMAWRLHVIKDSSSVRNSQQLCHRESPATASNIVSTSLSQRRRPAERRRTRCGSATCRGPPDLSLCGRGAAAGTALQAVLARDPPVLEIPMR